jgi:hypothetical protein
MSNKSVVDDLIDFMLMKQRIIDGMIEGAAPSQEYELDAADSIIHSAITHARGLIIRINEINKAAYEKGIEVAAESNQGA